jgi:hypothetical protein
MKGTPEQSCKVFIRHFQHSISPKKQAAWRDAGMAASHYACQSPLNTIGLFHVTCFRDGVPLGLLSPIIRPRGCVAQFANRLWQNRGNFCYLSDAPRWSPKKQAAWRDAGMAASHYACQSPLNTIGLFHVTCFRDGVPLGLLSPIIRPRGCVAQFANRLWQNRGNFCYLSDAPRWRTAHARRLLRSSPGCVSYTPQLTRE